MADSWKTFGKKVAQLGADIQAGRVKKPPKPTPAPIPAPVPAPVAPIATPVLEEPDMSSTVIIGVTPAPPIVGGQRVIEGTDLTYLGNFSLPTGMQSTFPTSVCPLAGRRVGGQLRLFSTTGQNGDGFTDLWEFDYPGANLTPGTLRATTIRHWGDYCGSVRKDVNGTGPVVGNGYLTPNSLYWYEDGPYLLWSYWDGYNVPGRNDPSIGLTTLNDTTGAMAASGPWQSDAGPFKTHFFCEPDADFRNTYLNGARIAAGATGISSGDASSPWGVALRSLQSLPAPALSTASAITTIPIIGHEYTVARRMARGNTDYVSHDPGTFEVQSTDPAHDWTKRDGNEGTNLGANSVVWINTATRRGVIFFTYLGTKHIWYGLSICGHGFEDTAPDASNGPHSSSGTTSSSIPVAYIYDPTALAPVTTGAVNPWAVPYAEMVNLQAKGAIRSGQSVSLGTGEYDYARVAGAYFDSVDNLLFTIAATVEFGGDNNGGHPIINVFQVS